MDEDTVAELTVVTQALPVIGDDDHQRLLGALQIFENLEQPAQLLVDERDLSVIRVVLGGLRDRIRQLIGGMGVVVVDPQEERIGSRFAQPPNRTVGGPVPSSLIGPAQTILRGGFVVVQVEALIQAELRVQDERRHHGRRGVSAGGQHLGQGRLRRRQRKKPVGSGTVMVGVQSGHDRRVRRQRRRGGGYGVGENHTIAGQGVHDRRSNLVVSVTAEPVRPGRIQGDQEQAVSQQVTGAGRHRVRLPQFTG